MEKSIGKDTRKYGQAIRNWQIQYQAPLRAPVLRVANSVPVTVCYLVS